MSAIYVSSRKWALGNTRTFVLEIVSVICEQEGVTKPTIRQVVEATGISRTYACDVLNGKQQPRALICDLYRIFAWKAPLIAHMTDEQIATIEEAERLSPTGRQAA